MDDRLCHHYRRQRPHCRKARHDLFNSRMNMRRWLVVREIRDSHAQGLTDLPVPNGLHVFGVHAHDATSFDFTFFFFGFFLPSPMAVASIACALGSAVRVNVIMALRIRSRDKAF